MLSKRWPWLVYAALFALAACFRFLALKAGFVNDHFVYITGGRQMLFGEWPTRDWIDPGLPAQFLPAPWRGTAAAALFARLHAEWSGDAIAEWKQLLARA